MNPFVPRIQRVHTAQAWPLHDVRATRELERDRQAQLAPHTLMQRAGLAAAQLACAIAPHARRIWVAVGPGNNGGDGLEAALHLHQWGKDVCLTQATSLTNMPADRLQSHERVQRSGLPIQTQAPAQFDLVIDAMLGIGATRPLEGIHRTWLEHMHAAHAPILSLDIPSGLMADTGQWLNKPIVLSSASRHTLSFLTIKPGLWTADGRDAAGEVWWCDLLTDHERAILTPPSQGQAHLLSEQVLVQPAIENNTHKGHFGDLQVIGGSKGMSGAAVLAAVAGLHAGAGRVFVGAIDTEAHASISTTYPALMVRDWQTLVHQGRTHDRTTTVCGCGGGSSMSSILPQVLTSAPSLVLDADALNALAADIHLQALLKQRQIRGWQTVLTPHPLEAARLAGQSVTQIQAHRLLVAQQLSEQWGCVVVLKGAGTVVASPDHRPALNPTGNALLSTAGSGDVLAGLIGARMCQGLPAWQASQSAVFEHGQLAHRWPAHLGQPDALQLALLLRRRPS